MIKECKENCELSRPYEQRNEYIEQKIENMFKYFSTYSDMHLIED